VKIALLSDTHMIHRRVAVPEVDALIHAGDFTRRGSREETVAFLGWLAVQPAPTKVLVAGNHDWFAERRPDEIRALAAEHGVTYLMDEETRLGDLRLWGSPVTPRFRNMAFNRDRGRVIRGHWDRIPDGLDLLVTHGPPRGAGDRMFLGARVGCDDLTAAVRARRPRYHVFGHIHEGRGRYRLPGVETHLLNVATRGLLPFRVHRPAVLDTETAQVEDLA
jgi:Icc-related predicted phosphoesterase